ncbi:hypothetical protein SSP531S_53000 [Streptomyces spongiicola]|uniref:Methyltransferase domain-containing protein n=1 Tax=Streptomyces spongiicola TaxID=1690221 RepID=A0A388T6H5_9ACTN|nr:hypothetical protein SSP531S_53000 [Streptomyces spongiicola]
MVQARNQFLSTGGYAPVRRPLTRVTVDVLPGQGTVVDIGCGIGHYLAGVLDQLPGARGPGLDASVRALRSAARAHPRAAAASWDVFRPFPLVDQTVDVMLDVFAPRNPAEFHRALRPTGRLIVVRPVERHLAELRGQVPAMVTIDPDKEQRLQRASGPYFQAAGTQQAEYTTPLTRQEAIDLVGMTPSARHLTHADLSDHGPQPGQVTVSVLATSTSLGDHERRTRLPTDEPFSAWRPTLSGNSGRVGRPNEGMRSARGEAATSSVGVQRTTTGGLGAERAGDGRAPRGYIY